MAVERILTHRLEDARDALVNKCVDLLGVYKSQVMGNTSTATGAAVQGMQLMAPENLKLLPAMIVALLKNIAIRASERVTTDQRSYAMSLLRTFPADDVLAYVYPRFYELHTMEGMWGLPDPQTGKIILPIPQNATSERLLKNGLYLLEDSQTIYLWMGTHVNSQLVVDLFDRGEYSQVQGGKISLPHLSTPISERVHTLIGKIRETRLRQTGHYPDLVLVKEDGDPALRVHFLSLLVEDRTDTVMSYLQFLQQVRERVVATSF